MTVRLGVRTLSLIAIIAAVASTAYSYELGAAARLRQPLPMWPLVAFVVIVITAGSAALYLSQHPENAKKSR